MIETPDLPVWFLAAANVVMLLILFTGIFQYALYFLQLIVSVFVLHRERRQRSRLHLFEVRNRIMPPVSIIVPAYNEADLIANSVNSLLALNYDALELIVVDDGSTDETFDILEKEFDLRPVERSLDEAYDHGAVETVTQSALYPNLIVIRKRNGGRADAVNVGLAASTAPMFCAFDADSFMEPDALHRAVQPFLQDPGHVIAVGGTLRVANGAKFVAGRLHDVKLPRGWLPLVQTLEYLRAFLMARIAWSRFNTVVCISGAFGVFLKEPVRELGGYMHDAAGEDMDLVVRLHRLMREQGREYLIHYLAEPVVWTEVPDSWRDFASQRIRWQRGAMEVYFRNADMLAKPIYGRVGWFGLMHGFILDVASPVLEVLGYIIFPLLWIFGLLNTDWALAFAAVVFVFGFFVSVLGLIIDEIELRRVPGLKALLVLFVVAIFENVGYRQYHNICRFIGTWQYLTGVRGWKNRAW